MTHALGDPGHLAEHNALPATYEAGASTVLYVDPAGADANSGVVRSQPKQTIAAALAALGSGLGQINLKQNTTFTISSGLTWDIAKVRVVGKRTVIDASSLVAGTAVALTSSVTNLTGSYDHRSDRVPLQGVKILGSGKTNSVTGLSLAASGSNELAHVRATWDVTVTGFGTGLSLGSGVHNVEMGVDIYACGTCIDDTAAASNAGERIVFSGGAFFNSDKVALLHNSVADYLFSGCSFDYNKAVLDIDSATVSCVGCHTEGNDANYGTNYPFTVAGTGTLAYHAGILTGALTTIPAYVHTGATTAFASFKDTRVNGWAGPFWDGTGNVQKTTAQTMGDSGCVYSTVDRTASTGVVSTITLGTKKWDTLGSKFTPNLSRITAPQGGFYLVAMKVQLNAVAGGTVRQVWLALNGNDANEKACPRSYPINTLVQDAQSEIVFLNQGDYYEMHTFQDSGANVTVQAANGGPEISLTRVA